VQLPSQGDSLSEDHNKQLVEAHRQVCLDYEQQITTLLAENNELKATIKDLKDSILQANLDHQSQLQSLEEQKDLL
jgi:cell division protein FtsB